MEDELLDKLLSPPDGGSSDKLLDTNKELRGKVLKKMKVLWCSPFASDLRTEAITRFKLKEPIGKKEIYDAYLNWKYAHLRLYSSYKRDGMFESSEGHIEDVGSEEVADSFGYIIHNIIRAYDYLNADLKWRSTNDPSFDAGCPQQPDPFQLTPLHLQSVKLGERENLLMFILKKLLDNGYRRMHDGCYKQIESPYIKLQDGSVKKFLTHAWERVCDIRDFVQNSISKEELLQQWKAMVAPQALDGLVKYLTTGNELEFQPLNPDRHWHSFHNGLYHTSAGKFYTWGSNEIPPKTVSCKYHDQSFDESILDVECALDVPTPCFDKILEYQLRGVKEMAGDSGEEIGLRAQVKVWVYAMLGRLLFNVNEKDSWQVIPFFVGKAGTGKSLILKTAGWFFRDEDVETMSNKGRKEFGLECFLDKQLWRCFEVKGDFRLDQAQFQSMVSGEPTQIDRLYKSSISVIWKIPGILAGNEPGGWTDNSGSISRRILLFYADRRVVEKDPNLDKKIKLEMGNLLHKCCLSYLGAVEAYGKLDIWGTYVDEDGEKRDILPKFFHSNKERLQELTHPVVSFVKNEPKIILVKDDQDFFKDENGDLKIKIDLSEIGMPFKRFQELAAPYFQLNNLKFSWKSDTGYKHTFEELGIRKERFGKTCAFFKKHGNVIYGKDKIEYGEGTDWLFGVTERDEPAWCDMILENLPL